MVRDQVVEPASTGHRIERVVLVLAVVGLLQGLHVAARPRLRGVVDAVFHRLALRLLVPVLAAHRGQVTPVREVMLLVEAYLGLGAGELRLEDAVHDLVARDERPPFELEARRVDDVPLLVLQPERQVSGRAGQVLLEARPQPRPGVTGVIAVVLLVRVVDLLVSRQHRRVHLGARHPLRRGVRLHLGAVRRVDRLYRVGVDPAVPLARLRGLEADRIGLAHVAGCERASVCELLPRHVALEVVVERGAVAAEVDRFELAPLLCGLVAERAVDLFLVGADPVDRRPDRRSIGGELIACHEVAGSVELRVGQLVIELVIDRPAVHRPVPHVERVPLQLGESRQGCVQLRLVGAPLIHRCEELVAAVEDRDVAALRLSDVGHLPPLIRRQLEQAAPQALR